MNPHHVTEHNAYNSALNEIKGAHNALVGKYIPWYCPNGIDVGLPWGVYAATDGKYDSILASGVLRVLTSGDTAVAGDAGTWTPTVTDFGGAPSPVFHCEFRCTWVCLAVSTSPASKVFQVNFEMRVTAPWSGVSGPQFSFPSTWRQFTHENILPGVILNKGDPFGRHYPLLGVLHTVTLGSGGNIAGEAMAGGVPVVRFLSEYVVA